MDILDYIFPRRCAICDSILTGKQHLSCSGCYQRLSFISQPCCYCCGKPLESEEQEYCGDCVKYPKSFSANRSLILYDEIASASLARFKFHNRREYAAFYGEEMVKYWGAVIVEWEVDAIVPVPVHHRKKRMRGYNQAELIADEIGKRMNIPVLTDCLVREVYTHAQKELNNVERLKNLEKAFHFCHNGVKLKKVILVDDIYTTGATMEACSRVLRAGGVNTVYGITVATGQGY